MTDDERQLQLEGNFSPSKFIYTQPNYSIDFTTQNSVRSSPPISPRTMQSPWTTTYTAPQNTFAVFGGPAHMPAIKRESAASLGNTAMRTSDFPYRPDSRSPTPRAQETRYTLPAQHNSAPAQYNYTQYKCPLHVRSPSGSTISFAADPATEYQRVLFGMLEDLCTAAVKWHWDRMASRLSLSDLGERRRPRGVNGSFPYPPRQTRELRFMDYVSRIANLLWERARRDLVTPRRAEMEAVEGMGRLYKWAETVIRAWERKDEALLGVEEVGITVLAARDLCSWLGFEEGRIRCEDIYRGWGTTAGEVD